MTVTIKKAKTCNGCRAFHGAQGQGGTCSLGVAVSSTQLITIVGKSLRHSFIQPPSGGCPKPKTMDELLIALERQHQIKAGNQ